MTNFATLTANLNLNIQSFSTNLEKASKQASKFSADLNGKINEGYVEPAKKAGVEFKDVARIVQGILISKVFYTGLNSIRQATGAVWEFAKQLEFAKMAYSNLFGSTALAEEFINVLKDFAAKTPFTFKESEAAAKRLLAYGVQYKNVMYMMNGVLAASSVQGNPQIIESVSRALGQIYTKGRLMNEEMRQLAEAGIPAYEILREKLGLTQKQLQNLGREAIPASKAINALIDGMNERYSGVLNESANTLTGILSNIRDNATMLAAGMTAPLIDRFKVFFSVLGKGLFVLRDLQETGGSGSVFEHLIPKELHGVMRQFIANLGTAWHLITVTAGVTKTFASYILVSLVKAFNIIAPPILTVLEVLAYLQRALTNNTIAMKILTGALVMASTAFVLFKAKALAALGVSALIGVINGISRALLALSVAFVSSPFVVTMIMVAAAIAGVAAASNTANKAISGFFGRITSFNGMDPDKLLLPSQKDRAADLGKFNNKLDGTKDSMDELAKKTSKASKSLLSFDEAFKLSPDEGTDKGIEEPNIPKFGDLGSLMPTLPDFGEFINNYVGNLVGGLRDKLISAGVGAVIGGVLGAALGGPVGAQFGVVAGVIAGALWDELCKAIGIQPAQKASIAIGTVLGMAVGAMLGGHAGAAIGAAIGVAAGTLVQWLFVKLAEHFDLGAKSFETSATGAQIGAVIGLMLGSLIGGPGGAAIGVGIGLLVGGVVGLFWDEISKGFKSDAGQGAAIGLAIGTVTGGMMAGPGGAAIGAGIGLLVGSIVGMFWDEIVKGFQTDVNIGMLIGGAIGGTIGLIFAGPGGAMIGAAIGIAVGGIVGNFWDDMVKAFTSDGGKGTLIGGSIGALLGGPVGAIVGGVLGNIIATNKEAIFKWADDTIAKVSEWSSKTKRDLDTWWTDTGNGFELWKTSVSTTVSKWSTDLNTRFSTWWSTNKTGFSTWKTDTSTRINAWSTDTGTKFSTWWTDTKKGFEGWKSDSSITVSKWSTDLNTRFSTWWSTNKTGFDTWSSSVSTTTSTWSTNISTVFDKWNKDTKAAFAGWWKDVGKGFGDWATSTYDNVVGTFNRIVSAIQAAWAAVTSLFSSAGSTTITTPTITTSGGGNTSSNSNSYKSGAQFAHAIGGVFNREHTARFAENNEPEAIIPLNNDTAMRPFVDAVSNGISAVLTPMIASMTNDQRSSLQPLLVGTLIADDRSIKELERKMHIIRSSEDQRRG